MKYCNLLVSNRFMDGMCKSYHLPDPGESFFFEGFRGLVCAYSPCFGEICVLHAGKKDLVKSGDLCEASEEFSSEL